MIGRGNDEELEEGEADGQEYDTRSEAGSSVSRRSLTPSLSRSSSLGSTASGKCYLFFCCYFFVSLHWVCDSFVSVFIFIFKCESPCIYFIHYFFFIEIIEGDEKEGGESAEKDGKKRRGKKRRFSPIEWDRKSTASHSGSETESVKRAKVAPSISPRERGMYPYRVNVD